VVNISDLLQHSFTPQSVHTVVFLFRYILKINNNLLSNQGAGVAQSVYRVATGWTVRGSNPGGGEIIRTRPDRPWGPPSLLSMGTGSFPGVQRPRRGADHLPLLAPRSRKSRAIPLPPSGSSGLLRGTFTFIFPNQHKYVCFNIRVCAVMFVT
jgi:subtilisin family serine protease